MRQVPPQRLFFFLLLLLVRAEASVGTVSGDSGWLSEREPALLRGRATPGDDPTEEPSPSPSPAPSAATSSNSTSVSPSPTVAPSTPFPTTVAPTTEAPTTAAPTTAAPTTGLPTAAPSDSRPAHHRRHGWKKLLVLLAKTACWLVLAGLFFFAFGAAMSNRYRIYYYLRGSWYTFWHGIRRRAGRNGARNAALNDVIFSDGDMHEGLLMGET